MENGNITQPLDTLMTRLGLGNADLVKASTEQLSFKMVQKGRTGRHLTPNVQDKILNALLKLKPELKIRRRELFHYPMDEAIIEKINEAITLIGKKKMKYPQFVDHLVEAGVNHYAVIVAVNKITFYGAGGEAHHIEGPAVSQSACGRYDETVVRSAIDAAQKEIISHPEFLKRIYDAGIISYEVNLRQRKIVYRGEMQSYRENIPLAGLAKREVPKPVTVIPENKKPEKLKKKKPGVVRTTRKARLSARKRHFQKKRK